MYKLTSGSTITRLSDGACIPADEGNRDYREYLAWLADGNEPEPVDPETVADKLRKASDAYQAYVDKFNKSIAGSWLADGPTMDAKIASIRASFNERKAAYMAEKSAILAGE